MHAYSMIYLNSAAKQNTIENKQITASFIVDQVLQFCSGYFSIDRLLTSTHFTVEMKKCGETWSYIYTWLLRLADVITLLTLFLQHFLFVNQM